MQEKRSSIYLVLYDIVKEKEWTRYFSTEFEKEKFKRKLKYSHRVMIVEENDTEAYR